MIDHTKLQILEAENDDPDCVIGNMATTESVWKPIESAPILEHVIVHSKHLTYVAVLDYDDDRLCWSVTDGRNWMQIRGEQPTHWMYIPEPPK